jgi:large subunit ribosomal protein L9
MKVILQDNVVKLGKAGDIVEASPGYFRNFLQPRKLAVIASEGALKKREEDMEVLRKKAEKAHQQYVELADKITALGKIRLTARVGEGGKLYGKITNKEIAQALESELKVEIDKRLVKTNEEINSLGNYKVTIKLAPDVQSIIVLELLSEGPIPEATSQASDSEAKKPDRAEKE